MKFLVYAMKSSIRADMLNHTFDAFTHIGLRNDQPFSYKVFTS
jgi:hypothetical protein